MVSFRLVIIVIVIVVLLSEHYVMNNPDMARGHDLAQISLIKQ